MSALLVGYARCSTHQQHLTVQRDGLVGLGVATERIYVDHGLTGTNRERPGLREALLLELALYRCLGRWIAQRPDVPAPRTQPHWPYRLADAEGRSDRRQSRTVGG